MPKFKKKLKILITGFSGFVSEYFLEYLNKVEPNATVLGIARTKPSFDLTKFNINIKFECADLLDKAAIEKIVLDFEPTHILHLAAISSVAQSWLMPADTFVNNTSSFLNIVEPVRLSKLACSILSVGSAEEYGNVNEALLPLNENDIIKPISPYSVARISQAMLSKLYADEYNIQIVTTRSFNHIGPKQKDKFVIASLAKQLVYLSKKKSLPQTIKTGDLEITRDFLDVRDVVKAYYLLLKNGTKGEVYNICSGEGIVLKDIVKMMSDILDIDVTIEVDDKLIRPNENKKIIGSYKKINEQLGWQPTIKFENSIKDIVKYWQEK